MIVPYRGAPLRGKRSYESSTAHRALYPDRILHRGAGVSLPGTHTGPGQGPDVAVGRDGGLGRMPSHRKRRDAQRAERRRTREDHPARPVPDRSRRDAAPARRPAPHHLSADERQPFTCGHCGRHVELTIGGGRNRNHCPHCLYSLHVDDRRMGDRASGCGGLMAPIGRFERPDGEEVIVHRCERCGQERHNRVAADDSIGGVRDLPVVPPRHSRRGTAADAILPVSPEGDHPADA